MSPSPSTRGVGAGARKLRRLVGPTAWAVLEDLAADAHPEGSRLVAHTNVRRLADNLGLSKDTTARSLRRLVGAALVTRVEEPRAADGTFARAAYVLDGRVLQVFGPPEREDPPPASPARKMPPPGQRHAGTAEQVALFGLDWAPEHQ